MASWWYLEKTLRIKCVSKSQQNQPSG